MKINQNSLPEHSDFTAIIYTEDIGKVSCLALRVNTVIGSWLSSQKKTEQTISLSKVAKLLSVPPQKVRSAVQELVTNNILISKSYVNKHGVVVGGKACTYSYPERSGRYLHVPLDAATMCSYAKFIYHNKQVKDKNPDGSFVMVDGPDGEIIRTYTINETVEIKSTIAFYVYLVLCQYSTGKGFCYPSRESIIEQISAWGRNVSLSAVQDALKLLKANYIVWWRKVYYVPSDPTPTSNTYYLVDFNQRVSMSQLRQKDSQQAWDITAITKPSQWLEQLKETQ